MSLSICRAIDCSRALCTRRVIVKALDNRWTRGCTKGNIREAHVSASL